jgi:hypothetical protein
MIALIGDARFGYPASSTNIVSISINACRSHICTVASDGEVSELSNLKGFHAGATAALGKMEVKAINENMNKEVPQLIDCLEAMVHHEFIRLMRLYMYGLRDVKRMMGELSFERE